MAAKGDQLGQPMPAGSLKGFWAVKSTAARLQEGF
jgi:hypothetical protein